MASIQESAVAQVPPGPARRRESIGAALARNLVVARQVSGVTQHQLAAGAEVSRATVAQLETGVCDPRLSTVAELARALGVPPTVLLLGADEVAAVTRLAAELAERPVAVTPADVRRMRIYLASGLLKDRNRAAQVGAGAVRAAADGEPAAPDPAAILAAIFSTIEPGSGTATGAALGRLLTAPGGNDGRA